MLGLTWGGCGSVGYREGMVEVVGLRRMVVEGITRFWVGRSKGRGVAMMTSSVPFIFSVLRFQ